MFDAVSRHRRLWPHVVGLWLLLLAATWIVDVDRAVFDADEGALLIQAQSLAEEGDWWAAHPGTRVDPDLRWVGISHARVDDGRVVAFPVRPVLVWATSGAWDLGGVRAATLLGITGVAAAAWAVARLAGRLEPRSTLLAFWLAGAASPLAFQALVLQGHGIAVGGAALSLWAVVRLSHDPPIRSGPMLAAAILAIAGASLAGVVRRETLLLGVAIALAGAIDFLRHRHLRQLLLCSLPLGGAALGVFVDHLLMTRVIDVGGRSIPGASSDGSFLTDRLQSLGMIITPGFGDDPALPHALALAAALLLVVGVLRYLRREDTTELTVATALAAALLLVRLVLAPEPVIPGLLVAFPIGVAGFVLGVRAVRREPLGQFLVTTTVIMIGLVVLTQYSFGGGFEWGSRYLSSALLTGIPVAAVGLVRTADAVPPDRTRSILVASIAVVALAPTAMGMLAQRHARAATADAIEAGVAAANALGVDVVVSTHPELPRSHRDQLRGDLAWFHSWAQELPVFLPQMAEAGYDSLPVFTRDLDETIENLDGTGWSITDLRLVPYSPGDQVLGTLVRDD